MMFPLSSIIFSVVQSSLPQAKLEMAHVPGLLEIRKVIKSLKGIDFHEFGSQDVVRHHLVQKIVDAYQAHREREQD